MHVHESCADCQAFSDAVEKEFVEACLRSYRGSFSELYAKLEKSGFKILKEEAQKQETPKP